MLGVGPAPARGGAMEYPVNASKIPVTALAGSSYFDSADSFAMIRRARGCDGDGRLAAGRACPWPTGLLGVGGGMDLASGAQAANRDDDTRQPRRPVQNSALLHAALTATGAVDVIITDAGCSISWRRRLTLTELMAPTLAEGRDRAI